MIELLPTLTGTLGLVNKLKEVSDNLKDAELKGLIGDLRFQLADLKVGMSDLIEENDNLRRQLAKLVSADGDRCPKCKSLTYMLEKSEPDKTFGEVGGMMRTYLCSHCRFTEQSLVMPS